MRSYLVFVLLLCSLCVPASAADAGKGFSILGIDKTTSLQEAQRILAEARFRCIAGTSDSLGLAEMLTRPSWREKIGDAYAPFVEMEEKEMRFADQLAEGKGLFRVDFCDNDTSEYFRSMALHLSERTGKVLKASLLVNHADEIASQLTAKYGQPVRPGFWTNGESSCLLASEDGDNFLVYLFGENMRADYEILKPKIARLEEQRAKDLKSAF